MLPENVQFVLEKLNKKGFSAYAVGGCVRDRLLGIEPDDWDITTSALPQQIQETFSDLRLNLKGLKHGTVGVIYHGAMLEVTTFRVDGDYTDSRRPDSVTFTPSLKEDLARRDFTVNAMAMDINENIIDEFLGKEDLNKKLIRCVGDAEKRFNEDALRIMRGLRFASKDGFSLEEKTLLASNKLAPNLKNIAYERIYTELKKMLTFKNAPYIMEKTLPVFKAVFPTLREEKWQEICRDIKKTQDPEIRLALILNNAETEEELSRLKVETKTKRKILFAKNEKVLNNEIAIQKLMCTNNKELVLFLCDYLSVINNEDFSENAKKASNGITSIKELNIDGNILKEAGYKSYKIKEALNYALISVIEKKVKNEKEALLDFLKR